MRKQISRVGCVGMLFSVLAGAQIYPPAPGDLAVAIPFEFAVGDRVMPAGNYIVHDDPAAGQIKICEDGIYCETALAGLVDGAEAQGRPGLVFVKAGNRHLLAQVWNFQGVGREVAGAGTVTAPEVVRVPARELQITLAKGLPPSWR